MSGSEQLTRRNVIQKLSRQRATAYRSVTSMELCPENLSVVGHSSQHTPRFVETFYKEQPHHNQHGGMRRSGGLQWQKDASPRTKAKMLKIFADIGAIMPGPDGLLPLQKSETK